MVSQGVKCAVDCAVTLGSVPWNLWLTSQPPGLACATRKAFDSRTIQSSLP